LKGLLLAGGRGTRLYPATRALNKQLLPVFDTPLIYFPLCTLMGAGAREILVITNPQDRDPFERLLGDGSQWGLSISYASQARPGGIAEALIIGADFLAGDPCALMLGDNLIDGSGLQAHLDAARSLAVGATIFAKVVAEPRHYGVVTLDPAGRPIAIEEKPHRPRSPYAVTGLYFYDGTAAARARTLKPSARGELEITDLNCLYLADGHLAVVRLGDIITWIDAGTPAALLDAGAYVQMVAARDGRRVGCVEETAYRLGWIDAEQLLRLAADAGDGDYAGHLRLLAEQPAVSPAGGPRPARPPSPQSRPAPGLRSAR
jgi:glucose-1-phosphate thymidylyltransferase